MKPRHCAGFFIPKVSACGRLLLFEAAKSAAAIEETAAQVQLISGDIRPTQDNLG